MNFLKNVDGLYDFYTEQDKTFDGSINALKNVTGIGKNSKVFSIFDRDCNLEVLDKVHRDNAANLTNFSNHSLRNTFTTGMCEVGVNTKAVQEIFEHAHAETTMKIYAEATKDLRKSELINF